MAPFFASLELRLACFLDRLILQFLTNMVVMNTSFFTRNTWLCITAHHITLSDVHHMCSTSHSMKHHITNHITSHPIASRTTSHVLASHHMALGFWGLRLRVDSTPHLSTSHCRCASQALHSYHITSHIASLASAHHITSAHQMSSQLTYEFTSTHHTY